MDRETRLTKTDTTPFAFFGEMKRQFSRIVKGERKSITHRFFPDIQSYSETKKRSCCKRALRCEAR